MPAKFQVVELERGVSESKMGIYVITRNVFRHVWETADVYFEVCIRPCLR